MRSRAVYGTVAIFLRIRFRKHTSHGVESPPFLTTSGLFNDEVAAVYSKRFVPRSTLMATASDDIRERNRLLESYKEDICEAMSKFGEMYRDEIEALYEPPSGPDMHMLLPADPAYDEKMELIDTFDRVLREETGCRLNRYGRDTNLRRILDGVTSERMSIDRVCSIDPEMREVEMENYRDYLGIVGEAVDAGEEFDAAYLLSAVDFMPAGVIGGHWRYVDSSYSATRETVGNATVDFIPQDLTEGLPAVEDDSLDLLFLKKPGVYFETALGPKTQENGLAEAILDVTTQKLGRDGVVATDIPISTADLTRERVLKPAPRKISNRVRDPFGGEGYNIGEVVIHTP